MDPLADSNTKQNKSKLYYHTSETETQRPTQGKQESKTDTPTKDGAGLFIHRKQAGDEKQKRNEM